MFMFLICCGLCLLFGMIIWRKLKITWLISWGMVSLELFVYVLLGGSCHLEKGYQYWVLSILEHASFESSGFVLTSTQYLLYIVWLFALFSEGRGSLLFFLKAKGWVTNISAGVGDEGMQRSTIAYIFGMSIHLTDSGLEKVPFSPTESKA